MKYRPEIDGLRAIAVVPVILFHAGFVRFSGGFIGVDVFFVISGYLITTLILQEKEKGTFSLLNFYERRARRILPALFFIMFLCIPFAWLWLFPSDLEDFSESLMAVSTFSSNILFWQETGYWGIENELKPLLHTWTLAVEEQYYILFPLLILGLWKFSKRWILYSILLIGVISLLGAQWASNNYPTANFFLLPTRAWELAIGAGIGYCSLYYQKEMGILLSRKMFNELFSLLGLLMIAYSVLFFDESTPFPGFIALIPTVGTALVILFSSEKSLIGRLIGYKLFVGIGLISYSAYLWHQPLLSFARHRSLMEPDPILLLFLCIITFPLAYLSWRFVEQPFRNRERFKGKTIAATAIIASLFFMGIGFAGYKTDGFSTQVLNKPLQATTIENRLERNFGLSELCDEEFTLSPECRTSEEPEILVWGDSFAMHLVLGIVSSHPNPKLIQMTKSMCGPLFDVAPIAGNNTIQFGNDCLEFNDNVRQWLRENKSVEFVVLSSVFINYIGGRSQLFFPDGTIKKANINDAIVEFNKTLDELVNMGVTPVVFSPPPGNGIDLGRCSAKAEWIGLPLENCSFSENEQMSSKKAVFKFIDNIDPKYEVIRLDRMICENGTCISHIDSKWIFRDRAHLSFEGSKALGQKFGFYDLIVGE